MSCAIAALGVPAASAAAIAKILNFVGIATSAKQGNGGKRRHRTATGTERNRDPTGKLQISRPKTESIKGGANPARRGPAAGIPGF
jgi:hypothetical protein